MKQASNIGQHYYPETMGACFHRAFFYTRHAAWVLNHLSSPTRRALLHTGKFYIINAPYIFTTVWSVIKGWLDPVTVEKIKILGSSYKNDLVQQVSHLTEKSDRRTHACGLCRTLCPSE